MEKVEMKRYFDELYDTMSKSKRVENMRIFGSVMKEMMDYFIEEYPEDAESYLDTLSAVKWRNYLTRDEAEGILENMRPVAPWDYDTLCSAVQGIEGCMDRVPYYNSYALWVVMNMVYSDSAETIAKIMGSDIDNVSRDSLVKAVYMLALDKLKDEDGVFSVRSYFGV